jgi:hypothetical protein
MRDALEAYDRDAERVSGPSDMSRFVDTSLPVGARAEAALPLLRRGHADFRAACELLSSCRNAVARAG